MSTSERSQTTTALDRATSSSTTTVRANRSSWVVTPRRPSASATLRRDCSSTMSASTPCARRRAVTAWEMVLLPVWSRPEIA